MISRSIVLGAAALALMFGLSHLPVEAHTGPHPINFTRGAVIGAGFTTATPSSLAVGPDGRLYVANVDGRIQALTLDPVTKAVTAVQQITSATDLQEVFGIAFDPTDTSVPAPIYVTNTISGFGDSGQAPAGEYSGKVTKISGPGYATRTDIITGLPVSNSGHESNGLAFDSDGVLYIAQGSTTNAGVVDTNSGLFQRDEVPTSAAILVADINAPGFNGNLTYSPPNTYSTTVTKTGGDVNVYASGLRNPYDLMFHSNGVFYSTDNGPNNGYGPASTGCTTDNGGNAQAPDELNIILPGRYYGHPNRNRGLAGDARQCVYYAGTAPSDANHTAPIGLLGPSSNGIAEYTPGTFEGAMQGDLLYVGWVENDLRRVELSPDGQSVVSNTPLATGFTNPLDVAVDTDGTIYVAEYGGNQISFMKPDETHVTSISVTGVSPAGGPIAGGQTITITGTNFTTTADTTSVTIGSAATGFAPVTNVAVQNSTTITGVTSAVSTAGLRNVNVTNSIGSASLPNGYNYTSGGGTQPPVANAGPDWSGPIAHIDHAHVTLDARGSTDSDGFITSYVWREGTTVLSTQEVDSKQFALGEHLVTLEVTDNDGYVDTDDVRIIVTATAENPKLYYCFDVDGDGGVNTLDLAMVASAYGTRFGTAGYTRMRDWNADRVINSADLMGTAADFTAACPLIDQQIRAATAGMEAYQDINVAIAAGYGQITPYIPGQGLHMSKGGLAGLGSHDLEFNQSDPEALLYEPDASTPGGWRLGGAMYIIPITLTPFPPDGFATNEDPWHYHEWLCIGPGGAWVQENVSQATCTANGGVWIEKAGWLVHLWNYHPNPIGRLVEINDALTDPPAGSTAAVRVDANPGAAGIQTSRSVSGEPFSVDVVVSGVSDLSAFNFDLEYNQAVLSAPSVTFGPSVDRNPNANEGALQASGRAFTCTPPDPQGGVTSGTLRAARISCTSTGEVPGIDATAATVVATVTFNIVANATNSPVTLKNANVFDYKIAEKASCGPVVSVTATCAGATLTVTAPPDADGDGYTDPVETAMGKNPSVYCAIMRADVDGDASVSILDLSAVAGQFTQTVPPASPRNDQGPLPRDNVITILDLSMMAGEFTKNVAGCP